MIYKPRFRFSLNLQVWVGYIREDGPFAMRTGWAWLHSAKDFAGAGLKLIRHEQL